MSKNENQGKQETTADRLLPWRLIGIILTIPWVLFCAWLFFWNAPGGTIDALGSSPMALNSLGDLLAGLAAPLAFLWLFVATMVQSQELALQRRELKLTRHEFELNREVSAAQAAEAKKQADYIGAQTKILDEQLLVARRETAGRAFMGGLTELTAWANNDRREVIIVQPDGSRRRIDWWAKADSNPVTAPGLLTSAVVETAGLLGPPEDWKMYQFMTTRIQDVSALYERARRLEEIAGPQGKNLPEERMPAYRNLRLGELIFALERVREHLRQKP